MATNLRKGKKIRAFCYRMFALGAFLLMLFSGIAGRDALWILGTEGTGILTGQIAYLPAFREYMEDLFTAAILGYAGVGDDTGYPLTDDKAREITRRAKESFLHQVAAGNGDILYAVQLEYRAEDGSLTSDYGNITYPVFSEYDGHLLLPDNMLLCYYWDGPNNSLESHVAYTTLKINALPALDGKVLDSSGQYSPNQENIEHVRLVLAAKADGSYSGETFREFDRIAKGYQTVLYLFVGSLCLTLLFLLLSLVSRKAATQARTGYAGFSRKIWLECKLILIGAFVLLLYYYRKFLYFAETPSRESALSMLWLFLAGCLLYLICTDASQNGSTVFSNSLPVKLVRYAAEFIHALPWYRRAMTMCTCTLLGALVVLATGGYLAFAPSASLPLPLAIRNSAYIKHLQIIGIVLLVTGLLLFLVFLRLRRFTRDTRTVADRLSHMRLGELHPPLVLPAHSLLLGTASDINQLESSIENAVEQKNRSNRMRVELITNVSHDLKTPLTSIINYADLLCEEELPPSAAEYASALQKKAYRLKNMVQDVFELSKATSGNLPVEKQLLDLAKLIRQTLADMDERIAASSLSFKVQIGTEPVMIEADGEKLYRVFQNLFVNALQYSLENSRVYIQLSLEDRMACVKVKNTSKWELDFDPEEILERFVRADASRTSEGSGLGLSIAQSFTEACGGSFTIETDGDRFTACVRIPLAQPEAVSQGNDDLTIAALAETLPPTEETAQPKPEA